MVALGHGQDGDAGVVHHHGQGSDGPRCPRLLGHLHLEQALEGQGEFLIYEPDPKHAKILCEEMGLKEDSKGLGAPVAREDAAATEEELLGPEETTSFRALAARAKLHRPGQGGLTVRGEGAMP